MHFKGIGRAIQRQEYYFLESIYALNLREHYSLPFLLEFGETALCRKSVHIE